MPLSSTVSSPIREQFILRFPQGMREKLKVLAATNRRSLNAELLLLIEHGLAATERSGAISSNESSNNQGKQNMA